MNELCGVRAVRAVRRRDAVRVFVCLNRRTLWGVGNWATQHVRQTLRWCRLQIKHAPRQSNVGKETKSFAKS